MKPVIGITCGWIEEGENRSDVPNLPFDYLKSQYSEKIATLGGIPVILPNIPKEIMDENYIPELVSRLDGIIFSGGGDMEPALYGDTQVHPKTGFRPERHRRRDAFELALAKYVIHSTDLPVLGICRGHQLINVALGGTLWQDVSQFWETKPPVIIEHRRYRDKDGRKKRSWHRVKIAKNSLLYRIMGREVITVNSSHHQIVKDLGGELVVSAVSPDGAVEALELPDRRRFLLTVQWHPEAMDDETSTAIFSEFLKFAEKT